MSGLSIASTVAKYTASADERTLDRIITRRATKEANKTTQPKEQTVSWSSILKNFFEARNKAAAGTSTYTEDSPPVAVSYTSPSCDIFSGKIRCY